MVASKSASRYAKALLKLAEEKGELYKTLEDMNLIDQALSESSELTGLLRSKIVSSDRKKQVLHKALEGNVNDLTLSFVDLVIDKGRVDQLPSIIREFIRQYNRMAGIMDVQVYVASELEQDQVDALQQALEQRTQHKVNLDIRKDPSLKGGLAIKMGDTVIDGTVKHKLLQLQERFKETNV